MTNINKEKIHKSINEAYNGQTEKVKELLESAKKNLADQKECEYDYTTNKQKVNQVYKVNKVIKKSKLEKKEAEDKINEKFIKMDERLNINSKNLDIIFQNVADNTKKEINMINKIDKKQENNNQILSETIKELSKDQKAIKEELINSNINTEKNIIEKQKNLEKNINKKFENIDKIKTDIQDTKTDTIKVISEGQTKIQNTLLDANSSMEYSIMKGQKETENRIIYHQNAIQAKMDQIQQINEIKLEEIKEQIIKAYQKENKHAINTLLEERNAYLKELEEKDKEIRQLNYKIYEYEEKLEKEIEKRKRFSILNLFIKREEEEEEPTYTCQILNSVY